MSGVSVVAAGKVALRKDRFPGLGPRAYCITVEGDGMRPRFAAGDVLVIDPDRIPQPGDMVVVYGDAKIAVFGRHDGHPGLFHAVVGVAPP